jgi:opacity protein-like surface antigen
LLAPSGHGAAVAACLLLGQQRTTFTLSEGFRLLTQLRHWRCIAALIAPTPAFIQCPKAAITLGTVRARFGYVIDNALFYATGGLAYGSTSLQTSVIGVGRCGPVGVCATASSTQWMAGWTAGAGFEWAFASMGSLNAEYLYYDLGSRSQTQFDPADTFGAPYFSSSAAFRGDIVRVGLNYYLH